MKFYPQDWRADEKLRLCSLASRGVWIECLALMHRAEKYGHLLIGGKIPTVEQLAMQIAASPAEVASALDELAAAGVYSRSAKGSIYSRRMVADEKKAKTARKNGLNGGNPSLRKQTGIQASDKGQDKGGDKPHSQRLDSVSKDTGAKAPSNLKKMMFDEGVALLTSCGDSERSARSFIAGQLKTHGAAAVCDAVKAARDAEAAEPKAWIVAKLKAKGGTDDMFYASIRRTFGGTVAAAS